MTKSIICSTAPTIGTSRSLKPDTRPKRRFQNSPGSPVAPKCFITPSFQSCPFGISGHTSMPATSGRIVCHTST